MAKEYPSRDYMKDVTLDSHTFKQNKPLPDIPKTKFIGWNRVDWHNRNTLLKVFGGVLLVVTLIVMVTLIAVYYHERSTTLDLLGETAALQSSDVGMPIYDHLDESGATEPDTSEQQQLFTAYTSDTTETNGPSSNITPTNVSSSNITAMNVSSSNITATNESNSNTTAANKSNSNITAANEPSINKTATKESNSDRTNGSNGNITVKNGPSRNTTATNESNSNITATNVLLGDSSTAATTITTPSTKVHPRYSTTTEIIVSNSTTPDLAEGHWLIEKPGWGGLPAMHIQLQLHPTLYVVVSQTDGLWCSTPAECTEKVKIIQDMHMAEGLPDIGYNFLIGGDGNVYVGRGWDATNFHVGFARHRNIAICFIGDYFFDEPTIDQLEVAQDLIELGVLMHKLDPDYMLLAHNQLMPLRGPGVNLMQAINTWPHRCLVNCDTPDNEDVAIVVDYVDVVSFKDPENISDEGLLF